jgi:hypothetical protein
LPSLSIPHESVSSGDGVLSLRPVAEIFALKT